METFRASKVLFGSVEVDDRQITIAGPVSRKTIPLDRVTAVAMNRVGNYVEIETGAQKHRVTLWKSGRLPALQDAIQQRLAH